MIQGTTPYNTERVSSQEISVHINKQRNAFSKNEAIIRPRSHHTMQRKPEDRVFPYNSQTCLVRLKQIIWYYYKCIVSKQFQSEISIIDGMGTIYHVAILGSTNKTSKVVLEIVFPSWVEARGKLLSVRDTLANVSGPHTAILGSSGPVLSYFL